MPTDHRAALANVKRFDQLIAYLRDEMGWPIDRDSFDDVDDLFYDFTAEELGIEPKTAAKIESIKRLRPLSPRQPWGIFFVKFEPRRLPVVALRRILGQVALKKRASTNSAERAAWSADDLLFVSNYGEGDERQISFAHFSRAKDGHDLPTLKVLGWDNRDTALHLDEVARELTEHLGWPDDDSDAEAWRKRWRAAFTLSHREVVTTSKELSIRLAELARAIRDRIKTALAIETEKGPLTQLLKAFQAALVHDLDADGFADMCAQTIAYGLLSSRIADPHKKTADDLAAHMRTNPFLRELMETFLKVGGRRGKAGGSGIDFDELGVSEVVELLDAANMEAVVRDFGDKNPQEDPVIHFYELFLKEYDAKKRMQRGVFYTPRPVVSYIVRSVDDLLRTEFGLADGLADTTSWGEMEKRHKDLKIPEGVSPDQDFVQILDPATGTGTFLVEVIDLIHRILVTKWRAQGSGERQINTLWNEYVPRHLLTRLHGFELLMAPYAIAHLKIGLKLYETGYRFGNEERARVYLANALEPWQKQLSLPDLDALAHEASAVNTIKRARQFTVVIGNPPYANFGQLNKIPFILGLLEEYKRGLDEKKLNLDDDFIKFIRFSQFLLDSAPVSVLALISNNTYLDGITHRRMRQSLAEAFTKIILLDLHGSSVKGESGPDKGAEENVFEIQQGVAIGLFARLPGARVQSVHHADLWGTRETKYRLLGTQSSRSISHAQLECRAPGFFFVPKNFEGETEYQEFVGLHDLMPCGTSAVQTKRDALFVDIDRDALGARMGEILKNGPIARLRDRYPLEESPGWSPECFRGVAFDARKIRPYLYRPFDFRFIYYDNSLLGRSRFAVFHNLLHPNLALATLRQTVDDSFRHVLATRGLCDINLTIGHHVSDQVFPLYVYPDPPGDLLGSRRTANISPSFVRRLASVLNLVWLGDGNGDLRRNVGPEDVFHYVYGILHSPTYRSRYSSFLRIAFPRIPLPKDGDTFRGIAGIGRELVALHVMESSRLDRTDVGPTFEGPKNAEVGRVGWSTDTVWLDAAKDGRPAGSGSAGFRGVPEAVWNFQIGGYQVCEKWLKDRKGRTLSKHDIAHYRKVVTALSETIRLMKEIDEVIEQHGGWPGAFQPSHGADTVTRLEHEEGPADAAKESTRDRYELPLFRLPIAAEPAPDDLPRESADPEVKSREPVDTYELMALLRQTAGTEPKERRSLIRELSAILGHQRLGSRIRQELDDAVRTAVRRGILAHEGGGLRLLATSIEGYDRSFLKDQFLASLEGRRWEARDSAILHFARWLGFRRTGATIDETARSLINGLLREGRLEADGELIRRVP